MRATLAGTATFLAVLVVLFGTWQLAGEHPLDDEGESSPGESATRHPRSAATGDVVRAPEEANPPSSREPVAAGGPNESDDRVIDGIVRLSCGVPLGGRRMVLAEPGLDRAEVLREGPGEGFVRPFVTREDGSFRVEVPGGLESARVWLVREAHLDQIEDVLSLAEDGLEIVYRASAVDVRVLDTAGNPLADAHVSLTVEGPAPGRPPAMSMKATTDAIGQTQFVLAASGEGIVRVVGPDFEGFATAEFSLPLVTTHVERSLILDNSSNVTVLRLEVVAAATGQPTPYLAQLEATNPRQVVTRIDSLEVPPDGLVFGLPAGEFVVRLVDRYRMPPSLYVESDLDAREVRLAPGLPATVRFELETRARAVLDLSGIAEGGEALHVFIREADWSGDGDWQRIKVLAELDPAGEVTGKSLILEAGRRYLTPSLAEGLFELRLSGSRSEEDVARETVELRSTDLPTVRFETP